MNDKRTQKNIRRNRRRRGVVIEMAILMMVVVVALSGLLTSTAIMQLDKQNRSQTELELLEKRAILDQIGQDFYEQQEHYVLPDGVVGHIGYIYESPDNVCLGCCIHCNDCYDIYKINEEDAVENPADGEAVADGKAPDNETANDDETTDDGLIDGRQESVCCSKCGCSTGCIGYKYITLQIYSDASKTEVVLTVILERNDNGTHTVTYWSYGG